MTDFHWKETYRIGDAIIDTQHQYLFAIANDLLQSRSKGELTFNAMKLFRYAREHFRHEEGMMRQILYPAFHEHVALHEKLIRQLTAISSDIHNDRWSAAALQRFMDEWLGAHIAEEDAKLGRFIREQAAAIPAPALHP